MSSSPPRQKQKRKEAKEGESSRKEGKDREETAAKKRKIAPGSIKEPKLLQDKILAAIRSLKSPNGSSSQAIKKYIFTTWAYSNNSAVKKSLQAAVKKGVLTQNKASFLVAGDEVYEDLSPQIVMATIKEGTGSQTVGRGDEITVAYRGTLQKDDSEFDKGSNFSFIVEAGDVIKGMDRGVKGMRVGEKRRVVIPPELGYGKRGSGPDIPGNSTLVFEITLKSMK